MIHFPLLGNGEFDAKHAIGPAIWPHFDLLVIRGGKVWIRFQQQERSHVELDAGQAVLIYPDTHFHGQSITPVSQATVAHFVIRSGAAGASELPQPLQRLVGRNRGFELYARPMDQALANDLQRSVELAQMPSSARTQAMRAALLVLILAQLQMHRSPAPSPETLDEGHPFGPLVQWLGTQLNRSVPISEMAEFVGLSPSHFRAAFARRIGESPGRFVQRLRYSEATRLLRETRMPIKQVARELGFDDLAHFYRFFSAHAALTPGQFRARNQVRG